MASRPSGRLALVSAMAKAASTDLSPARVYRADEVVPSKILPTGHDNLDLALCIGGLPMGRLITLYGDPQCGKCVPADTYLYTAKGLMTVAEVFEQAGHRVSSASKVVEEEVYLTNRYGGCEWTSHLTWNGVRSVFRVEAEDGTVVRSTANHAHLVMGKAGYHVWRKTKDLEEGDFLVLASRAHAAFTLDHEEKMTGTPEANLVGILVAGGHFAENRISVTNNDPEVQKALRQIGPQVLGVVPLEYKAGDSIDFHFNSKAGVQAFYDRYGLRPGVAKDKVVPLRIRTSHERRIAAFLRGYVDCEGSCNGKTLEVSSASWRLINEVRHLMRTFDVYSTIRKKPVDGVDYWRLFVTGEDLREYMRKVGTWREDWTVEEGRANRDVVPCVGPLLDALYEGSETTRDHSRACQKLRREEHCHAATLSRALHMRWDQKTQALRKHLLEMTRYRYVRVVEVRPDGEEPTFDVVMPKSHSFVAEGVITHNTTFAIEMIREAQARGGIGVYYDFENKLEIPYVEQLGVDMDYFIHDTPAHIEEAMEKTEDHLRVLRAEDEKAPVIFVWDSVSDAKSKAVFEGKWDKNNWAGEARVYGTHLSRYARMVAGSNAIVLGIAQKRITMKGQIAMQKVGPGNCWLHKNTVVLSWTRRDKQKGKVSGPIGEVSTIEVSKNQVGIAWRTAELFLEYGAGYDQEFSTMQAALAAGVVTKSGSWYSLGEARIGQGKDKVMELLKTKPKLLADVRKHLRASITAEVVGYDPDELEEEE